ncbi:MAG: pitrilysin family protein [Acidobacteriota bacterium]
MTKKNLGILIVFIITLFIFSGAALSQQKVANRVKAPLLNRTTLKNGLQMIIVEHHELPIVACNLMIKSGSLHDPEGKAGMASITGEMLKLGTKTKNSIDIANAFDSLGAQLGISSDWDATYITAQSLSGDFEKIVSLVSDLLLNPAFPEEEFKLVRERRLAAQKRNLDDPAYLAGKHFNKVLFQGHPYAYPTEGTAETVASITLDDVRNFYSRFFIPNNSILCIVGDVFPAQARAIIEAGFGNWKKGKALKAEFPSVRNPEGTIIRIVNKPDLTQSQIRIGHLGQSRSCKDYFAIQVMNYIYGGGSFSSRLMKIIRAERGYTYGIRSSFDWRKNTGPFAISTFTVNKQVKDLIVETLQIAEDIRNHGVTEDELKAAKSFYIGNWALQFETPMQIAGQILNMELYNLGKDYIEKYQDNMEKISLEDVKRAASQYLDTKNLVICVASNAADLKEDMEKIGKVEVVDLE